MGYKLDNETQTWSAYFNKRHPITRVPVGLRRTKLKSKAEAVRVERELIALVERKLSLALVPTWETAVTLFLADLEKSDMSKKTSHSYACMLKAHTLEPWGSRPVDALTPQEIRELIRDKLGDRTDHTKKYVLKCIRGVFKFAVENGMLNHNPTPDMKFRLGDKIKQHLTEPQVRTLLNKAREYNHPWYYHWALALYTGMRNGELYSLTWDRVDLDNNTILVNSSWNSKDGFKETKSGDDRIVGIAPALLPVLKELKLQTANGHFVLPRSSAWDDGDQALELRRFLIGLGLPQIRFHDLRATWATLLLCKGVEPIKVMAMGGWRNIKTLQIYVRKAGVDVKGAIDVLDLHNPSNEGGKVLNFG